MASPNPKLTNTNGSEQDDQEYDPTAEALIDEIDDERTLDEEEALEGLNEDDEVDDLRKDAEMPLDELLAHYNNYLNSSGAQEGSSSEQHQQHGNLPRDDQNLINSDTLQMPILNQYQHESPHVTQEHATNVIIYDQQDYQQHDQSQASVLPQSLDYLAVLEDEQLATNVDVCNNETETHSSTTVNQSERFNEDPLNPLLAYELDDSDDDGDYSYSDEDVDNSHDWRRSIQVGPEHQACIPEGLCHYDDAPPYENEDRLMWCYKDMTDEEVDNFLIKAATLSSKTSKILATMPPLTDDCLRRHQQNFYYSNETLTMSNSEGDQPMQVDDLYMEQSRKQKRFNQQDMLMQQQANIPKDINENNSIFNSQNLSNMMTGNVQTSFTDCNQTSLASQPDHGVEENRLQRNNLNNHNYIQDEEQLLYLLLQCNHNVEEALRRRRLDPIKYYTYEPMSSWSQEECLGFENGLRTFGKDFRSINQNKVQTRSHSELVAFYYIWKKSERHDLYINQYKMDRKKCFAHPGTTDYMDKFIEENEAILASPQVSTMDLCNSQVAQTDASLQANRSGAMMSSHNFPIFQQYNDNSVNMAQSNANCTNPTT